MREKEPALSPRCPACSERGPRPAPQSIKKRKFRDAKMHRLLIQQRRLEREFRVFKEQVKRQKKERRGGAREGSGHPQRRPTPWPEELGREMSKPEGFWAFLQNMAREAWIQNVLDARIVGALNSTFRLMADLKGWIEKAPLVIQAQTMISVELAKVMALMPKESRFEFIKAVRQLEMEQKRDQAGSK